MLLRVALLEAALTISGLTLRIALRLLAIACLLESLLLVISRLTLRVTLGLLTVSCLLRIALLETGLSISALALRDHHDYSFYDILDLISQAEILVIFAGSRIGTDISRIDNYVR